VAAARRHAARRRHRLTRFRQRVWPLNIVLFSSLVLIANIFISFYSTVINITGAAGAVCAGAQVQEFLPTTTAADLS
jgi:predicted membrane-bound mannosyltransferase